MGNNKNEKHDHKRFSIIHPIGYRPTSCGYCHGQAGVSRTDFWARAEYLTATHYKMLLDRGWRRSGSLLYKPNNIQTCCPHYSIRLPVAQLKPRADQKQSCNRWNKFVMGPDYIRDSAIQYPVTKKEKAARKSSEFNLAEAIHTAEYQNLKIPPEPAHQFQVTLESSEYSREKFDLYANYQTSVHGDRASDLAPTSFRQFLCDSPMIPSEQNANGKSQKWGTYHQMYRLNGRLIAMGVLDLLPDCVSSVYFIYHSDFTKFSFGKLSALREACFAMENNFKYYYMGYYIHSCPKMRYKMDYHPQYVLDISNGEWDIFDSQMASLMSTHKFVSLSELETRSKQENKKVLELEDLDQEFSVSEEQARLGADLITDFIAYIGPEVAKENLIDTGHHSARSQ